MLPTDEEQEPNDEAINSEPIQNIEEERPNTVESTFIEELLKKTDELSGNIVKLQMQIENQESEFKIRLENETVRSQNQKTGGGDYKAACGEQGTERGQSGA